MTEDVSTDQRPGSEAERHASWAELFFDLVVVAGVGLLAHVLATDVGPETVGLYAVLFLAFWLTWTTFMLYGNVAAGNTHTVRLLVGMFGLGVMVAAVPGVAHDLLTAAGGLGEAAGEAAGEGHASGPSAVHVFAAAYVLTRWYGSQSWQRGQVLLDFPVAQHLAGTLPWLVSLWFDGHAVAWLWAAGVALDLFLMFVVSGDEMLEKYQERFADADRKRGRTPRGGPHGGPDRAPRPAPVITGVSVDREHLAERLGLFVIIVLGEGVIQVIDVASEADLGRGLFAAGLVSFLLLAGMFGLSVLYGHAGLPHLRAGNLATRASLGLHFLVTGTIAAIAIALAEVVEHGAEPLPDDMRWLLCGGVAVYFALGLVGSLATRGFRGAVVAAWVVTGLAVPLLLGAFADEAHGTALVGYVAAVVLAHVWFEHRADQRAAPTRPVS